VRPFHPEKEEPFVIRALPQPFFMGDGNFAASPRKAVSSGSIRQVIGELPPPSRSLRADE
jgi:kinesin family protein 18/19